MAINKLKLKPKLHFSCVFSPFEGLLHPINKQIKYAHLNGNQKQRQISRTSVGIQKQTTSKTAAAFCVCVCVRVLSVITNLYFIFVYFVCLVCNSALETRNETQTSN